MNTGMNTYTYTYVYIIYIYIYIYMHIACCHACRTSAGQTYT